jgi:outer membrane protein assembly factor BamB
MLASDTLVGPNRLCRWLGCLALTLHVASGAAVACGADPQELPPAADAPAVVSSWPTYRSDPQRSGYTAAALPQQLTLLWQREAIHPPQPAWPRSARQTFDHAPQPIVVGERLFVGDSVDGLLRAIDTATGRTAWSYATSGPIRFAPAYWQGVLLVVSDDGYLHAVDGTAGSLLWKHRLGPTHAQRLGNHRLVSKWPARGGPVVVDGIVYCAAGIWPSDGVFVSAWQVADGESVWLNDSSGGIYMPQPHGGADAESGVSAQGYLVASSTPDTRADQPLGWVAGTGQAGELSADQLPPEAVGEPLLLVPTGRAVPAAFGRSDGRFRYFHLQKYGHKGGSQVVAAGGVFFNSGLMFQLDSGERLADTGSSVIAVAPWGIVQAAGSKLAAMRWVATEQADRRGQPVAGLGLEPLWLVDGLLVGGEAPIELIIADQQIVIGTDRRVLVVSAGDGELVWEQAVDGPARGLAAADGRLLVTTDLGTIYLFADGSGSESSEPLRLAGLAADGFSPAAAGLPAASDDSQSWDELALRILDGSSKREGYCLDFGCGDARLAEALARHSDLHVVAVDSDLEALQAARQRLRAAGLYGRRVSLLHIERWDDSGLPSYFADVVVSQRGLDPRQQLSPWSWPASEATRLQRPYGGVMVRGSERPESPLEFDRRGPLEGAGQWTHQYASAGNTLCSDDLLVGGSLSMLWYGDIDIAMPQRHGRGPGPLFFDGRIYSLGLDELACVDAYNGRLLWRYPLPGILKAYDGDELMGTAATHSLYCVAEQGIFVRRDGYALQIDRISGQLLGRLNAPPNADGSPGLWGYIACEDGRLYGSLADPEHIVTFRYLDRGGDMSQLWSESKGLFAFDTTTGGLLWQHTAEDSIRHNAIAVGGGRIFFIDRPQALFDRRKDAPAEAHPHGRLYCLDAASGEVLWDTQEGIEGTMLALSSDSETLLMSYQPTRFSLASEVGGRLVTFGAQDGTIRWSRSASYQSRPLINDQTIYAQGGAWDLDSGEPREFNFARSYGCGILAAGRQTLVYRSATLGYFDLERNEKTANYGGARPGCWVNAIPAGGLVLVPDASAGCVCSYLNQAWFALEPASPMTVSEPLD